MEGSGEISSFELQFMHIPIFIADPLLEAPVFAVYSLSIWPPLYQFSGMTPKAESVCKGDPSLRRGSSLLPFPSTTGLFIYPRYQAFASGS